jgi:NAD(P)H-hydrate epimerase
MKYVSVAEMIEIEKEANSLGLTYEMMMENAGRNLADAVMNAFGYMDEEGAIGLIGSGNNGGDALVALHYLALEGWKTCAYMVKPRPQDDPLIERLRQDGSQILWLAEDPHYQELDKWLGQCGVVMDGVLGTGIRLPLKDDIAEMLEHVRQQLSSLKETPFVVAVDCPSGVDCDSGEAAEECIPANLTVTMAAIKQGLLKFPAYQLVGEYQLVGIGLPDEGETLKSWQAVKTFIPDLEWVRHVMPERRLDAHKGTFGTALVVAGSLNYTGAAFLSGQAAYRAGAGLVCLGVPTPLHAALAGVFPEATWLLLPHEMGVISEPAAKIIFENLSKATALLVGPGLGLEDPTAAFISQLIAGTKKMKASKIGFVRESEQQEELKRPSLPPMVIDADGLNLLAQIPDWWAHLPAHSILTPHPGEMSVLTGLSTAEIQAERLQTAQRFSQTWGHIVILKGAFTVIACPEGETAVIPVASPALARAGSGDVLAGLAAGLLAQGLLPFEAAVAAAWIHAQAGLIAADKLGSSNAVLAGDILEGSIDVLAEVSW